MLATLHLKGLAFAAEGGHSPESLFWPVANFAIFMGVIIYFLLKPAKGFLARRRDAVRSAIEEAKQAKEMAEAKYLEYEEKLKQVAKEAEEILTYSSKEGELERKRIIANAAKVTERMKKEIKIAATRELEKARSVLKEEAVTLSLEAAEQLLKDTISDADQERLTKEYIKKMGVLH